MFQAKINNTFESLNVELNKSKRTSCILLNICISTQLQKAHVIYLSEYHSIKAIIQCSCSAH